MPDERSEVLLDIVNTARLVIKSTARRTLTAWLYVPVGIVLVLLACWGVDSILRDVGVSFPASVACMILLLISLMTIEWLCGERRVRWLVKLFEVPGGFALRWINVFFCPSFVLLPLSPSVGGIEVAKIVGVFLVGYVVITSLTAFMVRGFQVVFGTSKRAMTERAEELGRNNEDIPLNQRQPSEPASTLPSSAPSTNNLPIPSTPSDDIQAPIRAQDPSRVTGTGGPPEIDLSSINATTTLLRHDPAPLTRAQRWAASLTLNLDIYTYASIGTFIGLPIYYGFGYAMPLQLSVNVLTYFGALALPPKWKTFLHPVMVSSLFTVLVILGFTVLRGDGLTDALHAYQTKTKYTQLFRGEHTDTLPGAGDIFSSVLDVSIVALALPMFQYRKELKRNFLPIFLPNISLAVASLFVYPPFCAALGISPSRSLSFAARSLTLALATPATTNLGGDLSLVAVLCITSGMLGVLIGPKLLKWLRVPEDDYITRGVTLGANSSAIATALLLASDPRAAAFSSLSMSLFGTVTVALTSVPVVVRTVAELAGVRM